MYDTQEELDAFFSTLFDIKQIRKLGAGGFGKTVLVLDETEQIEKVYKLPHDEKTSEALKTEGKNLRMLEHLLSPNIIRLHKYGRVRMKWHGTEEDRYYLCLAYGGTSLRDKLGPIRIERDVNDNPTWFASGVRLSVEEALRISIEVCHGLEVAHGFKDSVRIIHRDIKPGNILIDDETGVTRIADFGISRVVDRSVGISTIAGSLPYMDPECFQGNAGPYSDLYSLGIVMYEILTGQLPFSNFPSRVRTRPKDPREWNPEIPDELARIILCSLENDLKRRYSTVAEMLAELQKVEAALNPLPEQYRKIESCGQGRLLCENTATSQRVHVHLVESQATLSQMAREAIAVEELQKPEIIAPLTHFRNAHILGTVSPVPGGRTLAETMGNEPVTSMDKLQFFCDLMARLCDVIAEAHKKLVFHCHLSPQNIYCDADGKVSIHGFGLAPVFAEWVKTSEGAVACREAFKETHAFFSPQLLAGAVVPAPSDDVFSTGAIMYALVTGSVYRDPADHKEILVAGAQPQAEPDPRKLNSFVTRRLAAIIVKALDHDPRNRPAGLAEIAEMLRACHWPEDVVEGLNEDALSKYEQGDVVGAYDILAEALNADPGSAQVHFTKGLIYYREKEYKWAAEDLQKSADVMPSRDVYSLLGRCFAEWRDQHEQAVAMFRQAFPYGENAELHYLLACSLRELGQCGEACEHLQKSLELETDQSLIQERRDRLNQWQDASGTTPARRDDPNETVELPDHES